MEANDHARATDQVPIFAAYTEHPPTLPHKSDDGAGVR